MKIGIFNNLFALSVGGGETYTLNLANALADLGVDITIIAGKSYFRPPRPPTERFPILYVPYLYELRELSRVLPYPFGEICYRIQDAWYRRFVRQYVSGWDILQCQHWDSAEVALKYRKPNQGVVLTPMGMPSLREKDTFQGCDAVVICGAYSIATFVQEELGTKCNLVPQGIKLAQFYPMDRNQARQQTGLSGNPLVLFVGRFIEAKNVLRLIAAFATVAKSMPEAHLVMIGDGVLKNAAIEQIQNQGLAGRVTVLPSQSHNRLVHFYNSADVFVLPSNSDFIPLVTVEAIACGCRVVVSDKVVDTIREYPEVAVARSESPEDIAEKIMHTAIQGQRQIPRERLLKADWRSIASEYVEIYQSILDRRKSLSVASSSNSGLAG